MREIIYTPAAEVSLVAIAHYTQEKWGAVQRDKYLAEILDKVDTLRDSPYVGVAQEQVAQNLRSLYVKKHTVYYMVEQERVIIVDILGQHMDPFLHLSYSDDGSLH